MVLVLAECLLHVYITVHLYVSALRATGNECTCLTELIPNHVLLLKKIKNSDSHEGSRDDAALYPYYLASRLQAN